MNNTRAFVIGHHTDSPFTGQPQLHAIDSWHKQRGFPKSKMGWYVGYHYVIEENGEIIQTRGLDEIGAHAVNCGCKTDQSGDKAGKINAHSIGVCLVGQLHIIPPTDAQKKSFHDVVWAIQRSYGSKFLMHREVKSTSCPGIDLRTIYNAEHIYWLQDDLDRKRNALRWAQGPRRTMLERACARIVQLLPPSP